MATLTVQIGNQTLPLSKGDLVDASLAGFTDGAFAVLSASLSAIFDQPLSALSAPTLEATLTADKALSWEKGLPGGSLRIHVTPDVEGKVVLRKEGEVFRYTESADDNDPEQVQVIRVPTGKAYVSILLRVTLDATGDLGFSNGAFGVKTSIGTENKFLLASHCCVDQTETIQQAIAGAFSRFVLPFDDAAADRLHELDYVEYEFFGKLSFGLAASAGFKGVFFGGLSGGSLKKTFDSELGSLTAKAKPSFSLGAGLAVKWTHEDAYRIVLGVPEAARLHLFLYKMNKSQLSTTLTLSAGVKLDASVAIQSRVQELIRTAAEKTFANVPDLAKQQGLIQKLIDKITSSPEAVQTFVKEAEDQANGFLKKLDHLNVEATLSHERISEHTALFSYDFVRPVQSTGLKLAMSGDFAGALGQPGVSLGNHSFVRNALVERSSIGVQFFEAFRLSSTTEYFQRTEVQYAGLGIFQLRFTAGMKASNDVFGHQKAVQMYFTAAAKADGSSLTDRDVQLFVTTREQKSKEAALQTAGTIEHLAPASNAGTQLRNALDRNPDLAVQLTCTFPVPTLRRLTFTPYKPNGKPQDLPHTQDAANYAAFVSAVDLLFDHGGFQAQGYPNAVDRFAAWAHYNITAIDQEGAKRPPSRRDVGNLNAQSVWPQDPQFLASNLPVAQRFMVQTYLLAAQSFMNLSEDLCTLSQSIEDATTLAAFERVLDQTRNLIKEDTSGHPLHFTKPTLLALAERMSATSAAILAPPGPTAEEFAVRIVFA